MAHPAADECYVTLLQAADVWYQTEPEFSMLAAIRPDMAIGSNHPPMSFDIRRKSCKGGVMMPRPTDHNEAMFFAARLIDQLEDLAERLKMGYGAPRG